MKKRTGFAVGIILIALGLLCGGMGIYQYIEEKNSAKQYEELQNQVWEDASQTTTEMQEASEKNPEATETSEENIPEETEEKEPLAVPIDFETLTAEYPDVYGWITIPGTDIDYPIVQREGDNSYYLNHNIDGEWKTAGAIFTEDYNSKDFTDPNTLIYGHNMKDGTMFRQLHKYEDRKFFAENKEVIIYQPNQILHYQIFAAYVYDNRHLMVSFDYTDPQVFADYIESIFDRKNMYNNIDDSIVITDEDRIITLSTCNGNKEQRYLVQAVLLSIEN